MKVNPAPYYTNISELRKQPSSVIKDAGDNMVAVFNHGEIITYMVSPALMEKFLEAQDDIAVLKEIENIDITQAVDVDIDDL